MTDNFNAAADAILHRVVTEGPLSEPTAVPLALVAGTALGAPLRPFASVDSNVSPFRACVPSAPTRRRDVVTQLPR